MWINSSISPIRRYNLFLRKSFFPAKKLFGKELILFSLSFIILTKLFLDLTEKYSTIRTSTFTLSKYPNALAAFSGIGFCYFVHALIYPLILMILSCYFNENVMKYSFSYIFAFVMIVAGYSGCTIGIYLKKKIWTKICLFTILGSLFLIFIIPLPHFFLLLAVSFIASFSGGKFAIDDPILDVWDDNVISMLTKAQPKPLTFIDIIKAVFISLILNFFFCVMLFFVTQFLLMYNFVFSILSFNYMLTYILSHKINRLFPLNSMQINFSR